MRLGACLFSISDLRKTRLFLLMTILSQSLLAFVSSHLVAFSLFSAWHSVLLI